MLILTAFAYLTFAAPEDGITRSRFIYYGFQNEGYEFRIDYYFASNGSLTVSNSRDEIFYIAPPRFQPDIEYAVSLWENETFIEQRFYLNGTDQKGAVQTVHLSAFYDFGREPENVKISLIGNSTDPDSEIEYEFENPRGDLTAIMEMRYKIGGIMYDWADLEGATSFEFALNKLKIKFTESFNLDPSIIVSVPDDFMFVESTQNKIAYANGRYWVFYSDGSDGVVRSSTDGTTWTAPLTVFVDQLSGMSIYQHGNDFDAVVHCWDIGSISLTYRRGTFNTDGSITWAAAVQSILNDWIIENNAVIAVDSNDYPYVFYETVGYDLYVLASDNNTGIWNNASAPLLINATNRLLWEKQIVALTGGKMYLTYNGGYDYESPAAQPTYGRLYNGTNWESEETITAPTGYSIRQNLAAIGDDVYLLADIGGTMTLFKRSGGSWTTETTLGSLIVDDPRIVAVGSDLWLFGCGTDTVYYQIWDGSTLDAVISLAHADINDLNVMTMNNSANWLGFAYATEHSPYYIKFDKIYVVQPPAWVPPSSTGETGKGEPEKTITEEKAPVTIPRIAFYGLIGSIGVVGVVAIWRGASGPPRRHAARTSRTKPVKYANREKKIKRVSHGR